MTLPTSERETLNLQLELIAKVENALGDLTHKLAVPALHDLTELRDMLCEVLPGGYFCLCENCELPIGCDEVSATSPDDGTTLCADCLARYSAAAA